MFCIEQAKIYLDPKFGSDRAFGDKVDGSDVYPGITIYMKTSLQIYYNFSQENSKIIIMSNFHRR